MGTAVLFAPRFSKAFCNLNLKSKQNPYAGILVILYIKINTEKKTKKEISLFLLLSSPSSPGKYESEAESVSEALFSLSLCISQGAVCGRTMGGFR